MPKSKLADVINEAQKQSLKAIEVLVEIMEDPGQGGRTRLAAATAILDRAFGKPMQQTDHISSDGSMTPKGMDAFYARALDTSETVKPEDKSHLLH